MSPVTHDHARAPHSALLHTPAASGSGKGKAPEEMEVTICDEVTPLMASARETRRVAAAATAAADAAEAGPCTPSLFLSHSSSLF